MSAFLRPMTRPMMTRLAVAISEALGSFSFQSLMASYPTATKWLWEASALTDEKVAWRRNLLTWTQEFDNAAHAKVNSSITANAATAPDGTLTADLLLDNATSGGHSVQPPVTAVTAGITYTYSIYAKAGTASRIMVYGLSGVGGRGVGVDLSDGSTFTVNTITLETGAVVTPVGNGWYRISIPVTPISTATSALGATYLVSGTGFSYSGTGTGVYVWGVQLEQRSTPTDYQRFTDFNTEFLEAYPQHTLFQDVAGTIPVAKMEDPIGLVLDTNAGYQLGDERITNGDFASDTGWLKTGASSISGGTGNLNGTSVTGLLYQNAGLINTRTYCVEFNITAITGTLWVWDNSGAGLASYTTTGRKKFYFTHSIADGNFLFRVAQGANTASVDSVSVREVPGYHLRQSNATARAKITSRVNLLTFTEQLDNAAWSKFRSSITANAAVAPDGTMTADALFEDNGTTNTHIAARSISADQGQTTISVYAKPNGRDWMTFETNFGSTVRTWFDLVNGVVGSKAASHTASITPAGNGWFRCSVTVASVTGAREYGFTTASANFTASQAGDPSKGILLWGAQQELGATASRYQRVVTATDYDYVGFPRQIEHDGLDDFGVTSRAIELGTQTSDGLARRNLFLAPTSFDASGWTNSSVTVSANVGTSPDGTQTADKLTSGAGVAYNVNQAVSVTAGQTYTYTVYLKADGRTSARLQVNNSTGTAIADVNLANGTIAAAVGTLAAKSSGIESIGSGWYRARLTYTAEFTTSTAHFLLDSATGDGTVGVLAWGAQLEAGATASAFQNIGTDKVTVFAAAQKLSDAAVGVLTELTDSSSTNAAFALFAPITAGATYSIRSRGSAGPATSSTNANYAAPISSAIIGVGNIAADIASIQVDNDAAVVNATDQGVGNYSTGLLYVGRRGGTSLPFRGRWSVMGGIGALISDAQRTNLARTLARTQGRTL